MLFADQRNDDTGNAFDRKASPISTTEGIPTGTIVNVPAVPSIGSSGTSPVVAVNNIHFWEDPGFLTAAGGALLSISDPVIAALTSTQPFHWRQFVAGCLLALVAWFRKRSNSVVR